MLRRAFPFCLLLVACAGAPRPAEFPVGFFGVETPEDVSALAACGVNAIQAYTTDPGRLRALSASTSKKGMLALISPWELIRSTYPASSFGESTWWYLQDEPDVNGISGDRLRAMGDEVKRWAPKSSAAFVVGDGHHAQNFPGVGQAVMVDWYPVPHRPIESLGDHVKLASQSAGGRKVWAVIQAMDWKNFPQGDKEKPRIGRFPTMSEIRFMSYDAVANGAQGVWYFVYTIRPGFTLLDQPENFFAVCSVAREMASLAAVVSRGRRLSVDLPDADRSLTLRAWRYLGRDYVLLLNRTAGDIPVPFKLLEDAWRPLFTHRRSTMESLISQGGRPRLPPYAALVLERRLGAAPPWSVLPD